MKGKLEHQDSLTSLNSHKKLEHQDSLTSLNSHKKLEPQDSLTSLTSCKKLEHQDSLMSLTSTLSVDSDWSDDEREELEKGRGIMFEFFLMDLMIGSYIFRSYK